MPNKNLVKFPTEDDRLLLISNHFKYRPSSTHPISTHEPVETLANIKDNAHNQKIRREL